MNTLKVIIISILFVSPCFSQIDLVPVYPNEISYQNDRAYFNGSPFTGLLVEEKTNKKLGEFKNGYKNGFFIEFHANGKKKNSGNFVNGLKDGVHIEIFENRQKKTEGNYLDGVKNGTHQEWYENGQEKSSYTYNIGKINNGTYLSYFENGKPEIEETFIDNEVTKNITYNIDGQYLSKEYVKEYYSGTSIKSKGLLINELKEGLWVEYHENGQKSKESLFLNGQENGAVTIWYKNGEIAAVGEMNLGKENGFWKFWDENGMKIYETTFLNGKRHGETNLFQDGIKTFTAVFENGVQIKIYAIDN